MSNIAAYIILLNQQEDEAHLAAQRRAQEMRDKERETEEKETKIRPQKQRKLSKEWSY